MTAKPRATRVGFTLVELLMVIAIIAVLAALLLTAIGRVKKGIYKTTTTSDISQMEISIGKFKETFNVLPPSHITLTPNSAEVTNPSFPSPRSLGGQASAVYRFRMPIRSDEPEYAILQRMFPRWSPLQSSDPAYNSTTDPRSVWQFLGDGITLDLSRMDSFIPPGNTVPPAAPYAALARATNPRAAMVYTGVTPLDSNQVLVLFLGGPVAGLTTTTLPGLSNYGTGWDVAGPTAPLAASNTKKGPHYDFPPSKLVVFPNDLVPRMVDGWGTPYAYFTASGSNYDARVPFPWPTGADAPAANTYDGSQANNFSTDLSRTTVFTAHAYGSNNKWMNPGAFQLVSAGPDKLFGPGSFFQPPNTPPLNPTAVPLLVHAWDAKNPQGGGISATYFGEGGGELNTGSVPPNPKLARGADDLCNFNSGSDLGTTP